MQGHRTIEQYQAQLWPAIKGVFESESTSSEVVGQSLLLWEAGCEALVTYISYGLATDEPSLRRSVGLLVSWLEKNTSSHSTSHPSPLLHLPVLAALARLYVISIDEEGFSAFTQFHPQLLKQLETVSSLR